MLESLFLLLSGLFAGFIDSIAGGGGLITLPVLSIYLGTGAHAIGTNKIVGSAAAVMACLVYLYKGHMGQGLERRSNWVKTVAFASWVGFGSFVGSRVAPLVPSEFFRYLLLAICPLVLFAVYRGNLWLGVEREGKWPARSLLRTLVAPWVVFAGFCAGFYDGFFGPGGGTVMLLGLFFLVKLPLLTAIVASKFVNSVSALVALATYGAGGYVHWGTGTVMSLGVVVGAWFGAQLASRKAATVVRPVLAFVVVLLMLKLMMG